MNPISPKSKVQSPKLARPAFHGPLSVAIGAWFPFIDFEPWTLGFGLWALDFGPWTAK
jgi:hypothetical protein